MEPVQLAAILGGAALLASMVSVEAGISVALVELALGVGLGNVFNLDPNASWLSFIAGFASVVLTFLAGAEDGGGAAGACPAGGLCEGARSGAWPSAGLPSPPPELGAGERLRPLLGVEGLALRPEKLGGGV